MKKDGNRQRNLLKKYPDPHYGVKKILEDLLGHPGIKKELRDTLLSAKDQAWQIFVQQETGVKQ